MVKHFAKNFFKLFLIALTLLFLIGCEEITDPTGRSISSIEIDTSTVLEELEAGNVALEDIQLRVLFSDGTSEVISLNESMFSEEDLAKLQIAGTHLLTVSYLTKQTTFTIVLTENELYQTLSEIYQLGVSAQLIDMTYLEWLDSIKGDPGISIVSATVNLAGHLILTMSDATTVDAGLVKAQDGTNGREIELRVNSGYFQWKYEGETVWKNLLDIDLLEGAAGSPGEDGMDGIGIKTVSINEEGHLMIVTSLDETLDLGVIQGTNGTDGIGIKAVEILTDGTLEITLTNDEKMQAGNILASFIQVSFYLPNCVLMEVQIVQNVEDIVYPSAPVLAGHTFANWSIEQQNITGSTDIYAIYNPNMYTVTFVAPEYPELEELSALYMEKVTLPVLEKEGYIFKGWFLGTTPNDAQIFNQTAITDNLVLYPRFEAETSTVAMHTVTYYNMDGSVYYEQKVPENTLFPFVEAPTQEGFEFKGFYADAAFSTIITEAVMYNQDVDIYIKMVQLYPIYYDRLDAEGVFSYLYVPYTFVELPEPTRAGYSFVGWYLEEELINQAYLLLMPEAELTLYAKWERLSFSVYYFSDAELIHQESYYYDAPFTPYVPTKLGYMFAGWYIDEAFEIEFDPAENHPIEIELFAQWVSLGGYLVTFVTNSDQVIDPVSVVEGTVLNSVPVPEKEGFYFQDWYLDPGFTISLTSNLIMPDHDITLYAQWYDIPVYYEISFMAGHDIIFGPMSVEGGTMYVDIPVPTPVVEGYVFRGWYLDSEFMEPFSNLPYMPQHNLVLYARLSLMGTEYTVSFETYTGPVVEEMIFYAGDVLGNLPIPVKEDFMFMGWYLDETHLEAASGTLMPDSNITLYAKWQADGYYNIHFETNSPNTIPSILYAFDTQIFLYDTYVPVKDGYIFKGWYWEEELMNSVEYSYMPGYDITVYAKYEIGYKIDFVTDSDLVVDSLWMEEGAYIGYLDYMGGLIKEGYVFEAWYLDETLLAPLTSTPFMPAQNITIFAKWVTELPYHSVYFVTNTEEVYEPLSVMEGEYIFIPYFDPFKTDHLFMGWFLDASFEISFSSNPFMGTQDITLYAKFVENPTELIFMLDGTEYDYYIVSQGELIENYAPVVDIAGYLFEGWFLDEAFTISIDGVIAEDPILYVYGKVRVVEEYTLYIDSNSTDGVVEMYFYEGETIQPYNLMNWYKEGHVAVGYYEDSELTIPFTTTVMPASNLVIYLKWEVASYALTLVDVTQIEIAFDQISSTSYSTVALTPTHEVYVWGFNGGNFFGPEYKSRLYSDYPLNVTSMFTLDPDEFITEVYAGDAFGVAKTTNSRVFVWGMLNREHFVYGAEDKDTPTDITSYLELEVSETIDLIAVSPYQVLFLTSQNRLLELGFGYFSLSDAPHDITTKFTLATSEEIIDFAVGETASIFLTSLGNVFTYGLNHSGELGVNTFDYYDTPQNITARFALGVEEEIIQVNAHAMSLYALTSSGRVFAWGNNNSGQLGDGTTNEQRAPLDITENIQTVEGETVVYLHLGRDILIAQSSLGQFYACGYNGDRYGDPNVEDTYVPTLLDWTFPKTVVGLFIAPETTYFKMHDNEIYYSGYLYGENSAAPTVLYGYIETILRQETHIFGETISLENTFTKDDMTVKGWYFDTGFNQEFLDDIMPGFDVILYPKWGHEDYQVTYMLDIEVITTEYVEAASYFEPMVLDLEGLDFFGWYLDIDCTIPLNFTTMPFENVVLYGMFSPAYYKIDYVDTAEVLFTQVAAGEDFFVAMDANNHIYVWGQNAYGELGLGHTDPVLVPLDITDSLPLETDEFIWRIYVGRYHTMLLTNTDGVIGFGDNFYGQISSSLEPEGVAPTRIDYTPYLEEGEGIYKLHLGSFQTTVVTTNSRYLMHGMNLFGNLGVGHTIVETSIVEMDVASILDVGEFVVNFQLGYGHNGFLTSDYELYLWGLNNYGQIGINTEGNSYFSISSPFNVTPYLGLGEGEFVIDYAIGKYHTLVLTNQGRVLGFGSNASCALNSMEYVQAESPIDITASLNLDPTDIVTRVFAGDGSSFILTDQEKIYVFGNNTGGKLGIPVNEDNLIVLITEITSSISSLSPAPLWMIRSYSNITVFETSYEEFFMAGTYNPILQLDAVDWLPSFQAIYLSSQQFVYEQELIDMYVPIKDNYTFVGWYLDPFLTIPFEEMYMLPFDITLYAKWIPNEL